MEFFKLERGRNETGIERKNETKSMQNSKKKKKKPSGKKKLNNSKNDRKERFPQAFNLLLS